MNKNRKDLFGVYLPVAFLKNKQTKTEIPHTKSKTTKKTGGGGGGGGGGGAQKNLVFCCFCVWPDW